MNKFRSVALYQFKTVLRSGLFRIFAIGATGFGGIFMTFAFGNFTFGPPFPVYGWAGSGPLFFLTMLNVAQSAILIFVASDIMKRETKFNSLEVLSVRSISNLSLVFGNAAGSILPFFFVVLLNLAIICGVNFFASYSPFMWQAYIFYPLTLILPTTIFIVGLTFFLMRLIPNQAVTVVLTLGLIGTSLFYFGHDYYAVSDTHGFFTPHFFSEIVGMPEMTYFLAQRGMYVLAGIALLIASALMSPRLPQTRGFRLTGITIVLLLATASSVLGNHYLSYYTNAVDIRTQVRQANQAVLGMPNVTISDCDLTLSHSGDQLAITADLAIVNDGPEPLSTFYLALNPGLQLRSAELDGQPISFNRNLHLIHFDEIPALPPNKSQTLRLQYDGAIDEKICYSDIDEETHQRSYRVWTYRVHKKAAFLQDDYVLLTEEALWYPLTVPAPGAGFPNHIQRDFINFKLTVNTHPDLMPISQGQVIENNDGSWTFEPEQPLPQLSLAIGDYQQISLQLDEVECSVFVLSGLEYFQHYMGDITDSLYQAKLSEIRLDFERKLGLSYPFQRFSLVEVPAQFYPYKRLWRLASDSHQPEQLWVNERGTLLERADLTRMQRNTEWSERRSNQTFTEIEQQTNMFERFFRDTFTAVPEWQWLRPGDDLVDDSRDHLLTASYISFPSFFESERWPLFHSALEGHYASLISRSRVKRIWQGGLSDDEKVSRSLSTQSLNEFLQDSLQTRDLKTNALRISGSALFRQLEKRGEDLDLRAVVAQQIERYPFTVLAIDSILNIIEESTNVDPAPILDNWLFETRLPGYKVGESRLQKIIDRERIRYQVTVELSNTEPNPGIAEISYRFRELEGRTQPGNNAEAEKQLVLLEGHQTKQFSFLLDEEPVEMTIDAKLARNLPLATTIHFEEPILDRKTVGFEGERVLTHKYPQGDIHDLIYDNLDRGFSHESPEYTSILKRWIHRNDTLETEVYRGLRYWRPPAQWHLFKNPGLYGEYVNSAYYIRPGNDEFRATWEIEIPEKGHYEIYTYVPEREQLLTSWQRRRGQDSNYWGVYTYYIKHADAVAPVEIDIDNVQSGWQLLGRFFFNAGKSTIQLSDKTDGRMVIADAIRIRPEALGE